MSPARHHRQARLPAPEFTRQTPIGACGLVFTMFGEDGGVLHVFRFDQMPGSTDLRRALVRSMERLCGPGRRWRAADSGRSAYYAVHRFLTFLSGRVDEPQTAQGISAALVDAWRQSHAAAGPRQKTLSVMRHILLNTDEVSAETAKTLGHRLGRKAPSPQPSYTLKEYELIRSGARSVFHPALLRIRAGCLHWRRWLDGEFPAGTKDYAIGEALDCLGRTGALASYKQQQDGAGCLMPYRRALGGWSWERTWGRLFLTPQEAFALAVLLVASEGWNTGVVETMRIPAHDPAVGDAVAIYRVELDKPRRPPHLRHTSNNLIDDGAGSPGRLMRQAIEATEPARQTLARLGMPTDRLLVSRSHRPAEGDTGFLLGIPVTGRGSHNQKVATSGGPHVSLQKLRRTVQVRIRKEPAQNSQQVHDSVYVLRDESTIEAAAATVTQGLTDAVEHARTITTMKMVLGDDADVLLELADHPDLARAVLAGKADTATAACTDFTNSPHAPAGTPCPASFLWCLACPNAIATRRHLSRLSYLHACLESLRSTLPETIWQLDWHEHHLRLTSLLDRHTTAAERHAELRQLTDSDRGLIDQLLRRRLDT